MADTWRRIPDNLVRKAFQEILEVLKGSQSITELPKNLWAKISKIEADASQAEQLAYDALQAAADAQSTADGKIVSYYQPEAPTDASEGDIWFDTDDDNKVYRYTNGSWVEARDEGIPLAIQLAQNAQATADGKIVTYYQDDQPANGSEGDLWIDTNDGNRLYRYTGGSWVEIQDRQIQQALAAAANAQATADGKIVSFFQPDEPTGQAIGDLWFDTDSDNMVYRWDGTQWVDARDAGIPKAINDAALAQATADSKIVTYYQSDPPTGQTVGDLWVDTDDLNHLYRWDGSAWQSIRDGLIEEVGYSKEKLQQDLLTGVSLVFKDISEFDETVPSAIAIGDITLNSDGTVAYGSRGVAITKNGLAGYDDSYNGDGDLPSFEIDTGGNATFRGTVSGAVFEAVRGSFAELTSGILKNDDGTNQIFLDREVDNGTFIQHGDTTNGVMVTGRDINFYKNGQLFKSIKAIRTGVAQDGDYITLEGIFSTPFITTSADSVYSYSADNSTQNQFIKVGYTDLSGDPDSGDWTFKVFCYLEVDPSSTSLSNVMDMDDENGTASATGSDSTASPAYFYSDEVSFTSGASSVSVSLNTKAYMCYAVYWNGSYYYQANCTLKVTLQQYTAAWEDVTTLTIFSGTSNTGVDYQSFDNSLEADISTSATKLRLKYSWSVSDHTDSYTTHDPNLPDPYLSASVDDGDDSTATTYVIWLYSMASAVLNYPGTEIPVDEGTIRWLVIA